LPDELAVGVVFPAYAGVILKLDKLLSVDIGVPRIRGGDPIIGFRLGETFWCSPHTRG